MTKATKTSHEGIISHALALLTPQPPAISDTDVEGAISADAGGGGLTPGAQERVRGAELHRVGAAA